MAKPTVIVLVGPTAVGKTETALALAQDLDCEIISADSMQVYRGMNIGTAKASPAEQQIVKHYLLDVVNPDQRFTAADWVRLAQKAIAGIAGCGKIPLITGGTGLYINALIDGFLFPDQGANYTIRKKLEQQAKTDPVKLFQHLQAVDPKTAAKLHPNDHRRMIRALEVFHTRGKPISELQAKTPAQQNYTAVMIGLNRKRQNLYQRIEQRVEQMIAAGLVDEVRALLDQYPHQPTALQAIGYKEIALYLQNKLTLDEAIAVIKRETRRYAKRQLSWLRRDQRIKWYDLDEAAVDQIIADTRKRLNAVQR
ncbi:MAG: tRNA (adenosine(37)-N6)-dimethylallyltransferase MiaA [Firmicutes bacterium]|nr:tRNA (adenosine(37)-N6)-dimethylallyltransferase MiaA [Bacillota bacterium]